MPARATRGMKKKKLETSMTQSVHMSLGFWSKITSVHADQGLTISANSRIILFFVLILIRNVLHDNKSLPKSVNRSEVSPAIIFTKHSTLKKKRTQIIRLIDVITFIISCRLSASKMRITKKSQNDQSFAGFNTEPNIIIKLSECLQ